MNKRIPRGLGVFVLLFSLLTISWLSRNVILLGTKAALSNTPNNVQISNVTDTSLTVSYTTADSVTGSIGYGKDSQLGSVAFDNRDTNSPVPHIVHFVTISNLSPSTRYFFSIVSGDTVFLNDSLPYEITTSQALTANSPPQTQITGQVSLDDGTAPPEAIVYIQSDDPASPAGRSQTLSTLLKPDGNIDLKISNVLKKDLSGPFAISPDSLLHMQIENSSLQSTISFLGSKTNPLPPIILGKNYDFSIDNLPSITPIATGSATASESAQSSFPVTQISTPATTPQILTPKTEQQFKDRQPLFEGKAVPGNDVEITIQSTQEITATVKSDKKGLWEYRPTVPLEPGEHSITIRTLDAQGILKTITKSFTVYAQGSQFTEPSISPTAKPSPSPVRIAPTVAKPTPTKTPPPSPTQSLPTVTPTNIPLSPTPTQIPPTPTLTPTPTALIIASTSATTTPIANITIPPVPNSGSFDLVLGLFGLGSFIGIGSLLFFLL